VLERGLICRRLGGRRYRFVMPYQRDCTVSCPILQEEGYRSVSSHRTGAATFDFEISVAAIGVTGDGKLVRLVAEKLFRKAVRRADAAVPAHFDEAFGSRILLGVDLQDEQRESRIPQMPKDVRFVDRPVEHDPPHECTRSRNALRVLPVKYLIIMGILHRSPLVRLQ
jgi:hypothetical protein